MPGSSTPVQPSMRTMRIGVDIGGTKTEAVAIDGDNHVLHALRRPTGHGNRELLRTLFDVIGELRSAEDLAGYTVASVGIGIPGTVDASTGHVSNAVNVGVASVDLGPLTEH